MVLRLLDPDRDAESLHAIFSDEESCRYMADPALNSVAETRALLQRWAVGTETTSWALVEDQEGPALGRVTLIPRGSRVWEAGIMLTPAARGKGLAIRGLSEALDHIFEAHDARRIYADIDPDNTPSIRLFEKLGFQREALLRAAWETHIGVRDSVIMGLVNTDPRPWR